MNSERIKALAKEIFSSDKVVDIGCDHGYLGIYLKKNNLCEEVYASDISKSALNSAINNFKKHDIEIKTFLSDGFKNIDVDYNTAVIAGMGTHTILEIIQNNKAPNKLVIASNNEYFKLRKSLNKMGYKIVDELSVLENERYYIILLCIKAKQKLNKKELLFGISNNEEYYKYLLNKNNELINIVPLRKKIKLYYENILLKGLIEKK